MGPETLEQLQELGLVLPPIMHIVIVEVHIVHQESCLPSARVLEMNETFWLNQLNSAIVDVYGTHCEDITQFECVDLGVVNSRQILPCHLDLEE